MNSKYDITIAIVIYNPHREELRKAIESVLKCTLNIHLYLIDNSPEVSDFSDILDDSRVEYIYLNTNRGFGAGHNSIMKQENKLGKYHLVLNPDVSFGEGVLEQIFSYMEGHREVGCLMPKVVFPDGQMQYLAKMLPRPIDYFVRMFCPIKSIKDKFNYNFEMHFLDYTKIINAPYLSGCFMFLRSSVIKEIGVFDEGIFMYGEDTDLTRRIFQKYKTIYYPYTMITHNYEGASHRNFKLLIVHIKAVVYYMNKWGWFFDRERKRINKGLKSLGTKSEDK